ncbi:MAG: hypothetical protein OEM81_02755 [Acidimicrobiia bacterium]|nr:hypothetical protein [Acidimicrobiia bacterium]MDH3396734.1 hypothetical protein [Acidimicrobiia bacterium]
MHVTRIPLSVLLVLALFLAACSSGGTGTETPPSTLVDVTSPTRLLGEWVPAGLRPEGLLIGDTLTVAGDRFVVFEENDGRQVAVWTSEDGRSWSSGDNAAFPSGAHVLWARGNEHGAIAVGWSGQPSWPPNPESPPVFDRVWTTTDGLVWTPGQFRPVLPESTEYVDWYTEVTTALAYEGGFLLVGQARWFLEGDAIGDDMGLDGGDIVAFPALAEGGGCTIEGLYRDGDPAFTVPCADYGIDPEAGGLFSARPPVMAAGNRGGSWEIIETTGLENVPVIDAGVGPDGVSLFSYPQFDVPRYWTSVDLRTWQTVEGIPGIEAEGVYSMQTWRDGWVADIGYQDVEGGELWWTRLGSTWASAGVEGKHGPFAVGPFGLITVTTPPASPDSTELWFTPDGVNSAVFDVVELFGSDAVADGFAVGSDSVVAVVSTFDESAEYPWIAKVWAGIPSGE